MKILITSTGTESEENFATELAKQAMLLGHQVHLLRWPDSPSPFKRKFDLTIRPETIPFLNDIADFHNFCEKCRGQYEETDWSDNPSHVERLEKEIGSQITIQCPDDLKATTFQLKQPLAEKAKTYIEYRVVKEESKDSPNVFATA